MFDFIKRAFDSILGFVSGSWQDAIRSVVSFIQSMFRQTYSYHSSLYGKIRRAWQTLAADIRDFEIGDNAFKHATYGKFLWIETRQFPSVVHQIAVAYAKSIAFTVAVKNYLLSYVNRGLAAQHAYTRSVLLWVVVHVLAFLYRLIVSIFGWIGREGSTMWHYFTHLDEFALLLFWHLISLLETLAWDVGARLGKFFLSLIVHNIVRFATLVETIVDAVL